MAARLAVEIIGDASSLEKALKKSEKGVKGFSSKLSKNVPKGGLLGGLLGDVGKGGVIGAGVAAGGAVAVTALKGVIDKAKEAQVAQSNLENAVRSTGVAYKPYGQQIDAAIQKTSKLAGIDDEELSASFANLVRTTGSVAKATKGIGLAANIARARHLSLAAATKIVEKAETGQFRGLKVLGVQVDKNTTSQQALEAANKKFAGAAASYGKTAAGAQDKLGVAFENVQERIGQKLLPIVTKLALKLADFLDWAEQNWPAFAKNVGDAYRTMKPFIDNMIGRIRQIALVVAGVIKTVNALVHGDWADVWKGLKQVAAAQIKLTYLMFLQLPTLILKALGKKAWAGLEQVGVWIKEAIVSGLKGLTELVVNMLKAAVNAFIRIVNSIQIPAFKFPGINIPGPIPDIPGFTTPTIGFPDIPYLASGGRITKTGVAMVHRGETVVPAGAGAVVFNHATFHIHGVQNIRELENDLRKRSFARPQTRRGPS